MKHLIEKIENERYSFLLGFLGLFSIIFIRNIFESSLEGTQTFGFSPISTRSFYMVFVHFPLFYFSLFLWFLLILYIFTKEKIEKISRVLIYGMWFIIIPPFVDILISKGSGYKLTYLKGMEQFTEIHKFFDFTRDILETSWGQRIEIIIALLGGIIYITIKTKNTPKAVVGTLIIYLIIFLHGALPNTIGKIPFYLGNKEFKPLTILSGNFFFIDSKNYAVIFLFLCLIPGLIILYIYSHQNFKRLFCIKESIIFLIPALIGINYGIYQLSKSWAGFLKNPLTYLVIIVSLFAFNLIAQLSSLDKSSRIILAIFLLFLSIAVGPIFTLLLGIIFIFNYLIHIKTFALIFAIPAGFSIFFQNQTFLCILPFNQKNIVEYAGKIKAWNLFLDKKYSKALSEYLKIYNSDSEIQKFIGQCYLHIGEIDSGLKYLESIAYINYEIAISLLDAYNNKKDFNRADSMCWRAVNRNIEPFEFLVKCAESKARTGKEKEMYQTLERAKKYGLPNYKYYQIIGDYYLFKKDYQNARYNYKRAIQYNPRSTTARSGLGMIYYHEKDYQNAENEFLEALKFEPQNDAIYNNLGAIYIVKKEYKRAKETFEKSLRLNPSQVEAYYNLGLIYENTGEFDLAIEMYKKALSINPQFLPAINGLKRVGVNDQNF